MRFPAWLLPVFLAGFAIPARANDWHATRAETEGEFEAARMMCKLDCAGLDAYSEHQRWQMNQWTIAAYERGLPRAPSAPRAFPYGQPAWPR
jgi:hypothetical protein